MQREREEKKRKEKESSQQRAAASACDGVEGMEERGYRGKEERQR
jgi:hypothetical protein